MTTTIDPARVGDYELQTRIGEGGMGVVYLGRDSAGRPVAVKVLRPQVIGDTEARSRLAQEVNSLRLVRSPRVAEILDADPFGPTPFVVTRYVPGLTLHDHVREEGVVTGEDLRLLALRLAEALAAVHAVGVLHRDVKPSNVLMEGRSPVLIDFGLARLSEDPRLTHAGWLLGTPGYLAPELLYGDPATPAADVHAWAATVVFAATGCSPYGSGPSMAILDRVRRGEHDLSAVPVDLRPVLAEALATEPGARPSLGEVLTVLNAPNRSVTTDWTTPLVLARHSPEMRVEQPAPTPVLPTTPAISPRPTHGLAPEPGGSTARSRGQRILLISGLTALTSALVALAPYLGVGIVAAAVLVLRTASISAERHRLRRVIRGRPRWYDVPATGLSTPWYSIVASFGSLAAVVWGVLAAAAVGVVAYLAKVPGPPGLLLMGLGFTVALWWGPGSTRLRAMVRPMIWRASSGAWPAWAAGVFLLVGAAVLGFALLTDGPIWSPQAQAPWSTGFLATVLNYL